VACCAVWADGVKEKTPESGAADHQTVVASGEGETSMGLATVLV
jgi:hypothetical protein